METAVAQRRRLATPSSLDFVGIDFETQSLHRVLADAGLKDDEPAFFSWLGVTIYLRPEAVMATLRHIAARPKGSGVAFDFLYQPRRLNLPGRLLLRTLSRRYARMGEPWVGFFDPAKLTRDLKEAGFADVRHITRRESNSTLFRNRSDGLKIRAALLGGMMVAIV